MKNLVILAAVFLMFQSVWAEKIHVAVVETIGSSSIISHEEKMFITDRLREKANEALPLYMGFEIMTRENITAMLPPGKKIEDCSGECLVETGRNISADFIAQARIGDFNGSMTITVELYETRGNRLVGTFSGRKYDADGLLEIIDEKAVELFSRIAAAGGQGGPDGISGFDGGSSYTSSAVQSYIIDLNSEPSGAMVSIDGRPDTQCSSTPCSVQLKSGSHRISFVKDMYKPKDTVLVVSYSDVLNVDLKPNFGQLILEPELEGNQASWSDLTVSINGELYDREGRRYEAGTIRLAAGTYSVEVRHDCYEPISFKAAVKVGKDYPLTREMKLAMGGLSLNATRDGKPVSESFYIDGRYWGETPFSGTVPICGDITIGSNRDAVPIQVRYHDEVEYTYEWETPRKSSYSYSYDDSDDYDYDYGGYSYRSSSSTSYGSYDYNYGRSSSSYSYSDDEESDGDYDYYYVSSASKSFDYGVNLQGRISAKLLFASVTDDVHNYTDFDNEYGKNEVLLGGFFDPALVFRIHLGVVSIGIGGGYSFASTSVWQIGAVCGENEYNCDESDDEHSDDLINIRNFGNWYALGEFGFKSKMSGGDLLEFGVRYATIPEESIFFSGPYVKFLDLFDIELGYFYGDEFTAGVYFGFGISFPGYSP